MQEKKATKKKGIVEEEPLSKNTQEQLELVQWLLIRYDNLRASSANRTAIVVSAYSLLFAGTLFLLDKTLSNKNYYNDLEMISITASICITLIFLVFSIAYAANGIVNVWKTNRQLFGPIPARPFFHSGDTVDAFKNYESFKSNFTTSNRQQLLNYALGTLWSDINAQHRRYQILRRSIKFFIFSIFLILFTIALIVLARYF